MGHDVFISFSTKDTDTAHRVYDGLVTRGIKCWISSRDIPAGGNYQIEIVNTLRTAKVMVLVFSGNANSSGEIEKELALASQHRLTIMPLRIDNVVPTGAFIYNLATSQWIEIFPDLEKNLDNVATTIKAITEKSDQFTFEVRLALEEDGVLGSTELKFLEEEAVRMGLNIDQARIIINDVVGDSTPSNIQEREQKYLQAIAEVLEDGNISSTERKLLASRAKSFVISDSRAQALLEQEMVRLGFSNNPIPASISSPATSGDVTNSVEKTLQFPGHQAIGNETPPLKSDEKLFPINSTKVDLSWPNVGYIFLKAIYKKIDVSYLPFVPLTIFDDEFIEDTNSACWDINDKHYLSVWFDSKSRRSGKVTIYWGFYSYNKARDPNFRDACKEICDMQNIEDSLGKNKFFHLNEYLYEFVSDGYLGFETSERPAFEEMSQESYIKKIADQLLAFSREIWPVVSKI